MVGKLMEEKIGDAPAVAPPETARDTSLVERLNQSVDETFIKVDQIEQKLNEVEQFYSNSNTKIPNTPRSGFKMRRHDSSSTQAASNQRMQDLMRQFGTIMRQLTQHHWAGPFMQPVDVVGLGLHDYYEDKRRKEEEAEMQQDLQLAQEAAYAKMARELHLDLEEVDSQLDELRDSVLQKCRKMTTEEKKQLGSAITRLSPEDINKALEIIAQNDPTFQAAGETVEVDIDAQSESTLWKLRLFVKDTLQLQRKSLTSTRGNSNGDNNQNCNNKRKRDVPESLIKTAQKKTKKPPN